MGQRVAEPLDAVEEAGPEGGAGGGCVIGDGEAECIGRLHEAIDLGIAFMDNAWKDHEGRAEELMGRALAAPGRRDQVFVMTKVCARDYAGARRQIEDSLRRRRTDRIDLLQFHAVQCAGDPERIEVDRAAAAERGRRRARPARARAPEDPRGWGGA